MNENITPAPTTAVNASPDVMSALMELSPEIADEILAMVHGIEHYKNIRSIVAPRQFSLSLESEDQANLLSRLVDALIRFLTRLMTDIANGTATMSFALGKVGNRAELINTESRAMRRTNRKDTFTIDTRIHNLCLNYRPVSDPQQLLMIIRNNDNVIKQYFRYQNIDLPDTIPRIIRIDPITETAVIDLIQILTPVSPIARATQMQFTGDESALVSPQLLGNQRLHAMSKNPHASAVEQLAGQEWLLMPSSDNPRPLPVSITYNTFASTIEQSILRAVISTTHDLEANFGIVSRNRRASRVGDLTRYLERIRNNVITRKLDGESLVRAKQIIQLLEAYCSWMVNPYLNMMGLYVRNSNAVLNVCAANN